MNKWFSLKLRPPRKNAGQSQTQRSERRERDDDLEATLAEILEGKLDLKEGEEETKKTLMTTQMRMNQLTRRNIPF